MSLLRTTRQGHWELCPQTAYDPDTLVVESQRLVRVQDFAVGLPVQSLTHLKVVFVRLCFENAEAASAFSKRFAGVTTDALVLRCVRFLDLAFPPQRCAALHYVTLELDDASQLDSALRVCASAKKALVTVTLRRDLGAAQRDTLRESVYRVCKEGFRCKRVLLDAPSGSLDATNALVHGFAPCLADDAHVEFSEGAHVGEDALSQLAPKVQSLDLSNTNVWVRKRAHFHLSFPRLRTLHLSGATWSPRGVCRLMRSAPLLEIVMMDEAFNNRGCPINASHILHCLAEGHLGKLKGFGCSWALSSSSVDFVRTALRFTALNYLVLPENLALEDARAFVSTTKCSLLFVYSAEPGEMREAAYANRRSEIMPVDANAPQFADKVQRARTALKAFLGHRFAQKDGDHAILWRVLRFMLPSFH